MNVWFTLLLTGLLLTGHAQPRPLRGNLTVDTYLTVSRPGVRLAHDPATRTLHYAVEDGAVYRIDTDAAGSLHETSVATVADHGINYLQGMVFADSVLVLVGIRRTATEGHGRVMKGRLLADGTRRWSVLLETGAYPNSGTAFDHAYNGVCLSPDRDSVYVSSGSRTDHGEVQDNGGRFPGVRETALTARIFKLPLAGENLTLVNDEAAVRASGLLFCEGVRNTYDLAFAPNGHLFGAENAGNRSDPEELNWLRAGHHYGFPWLIGGNLTPQQFPGYDPLTDPLLNPGYGGPSFHNDPTYPPRPNRRFTPGLLNLGPAASLVIDPATRQLVQADTVRTFTCHASPLGLVFDADSVLDGYAGRGFVLGYTPGRGLDLSALTLHYDPALDNYRVAVERIAEGFSLPVDAELVDTVLYVLERGRPAISRVTFRSRPYPVADLSLSLHAGTRLPSLGQPVALVATVRNDGPQPAPNVWVRCRLPEGLELVSSPDFTTSAGGLLATLPHLPADSTRALRLTVRPTWPGTFRVAAQVRWASVRDPDSRPNTGTADGEDDMAVVDFRTKDAPDRPVWTSPNPVRVLPPALRSSQPAPDPSRPDLSVAAVLSNRSPAVGEPITLTLTLENAGGQPASDVRLRLGLPAQLAPVNMTDWQAEGTDWLSAPVTVGAGDRVVRTVSLQAAAGGAFLLKATLSGPPDGDSTPDNGYDNGEDDETQLDGRVR